MEILERRMSIFSRPGAGTNLEQLMEMEISFPGGVAVEAFYKGFTVRTDQSVAGGGGGTAPSPFDLFLASLGTCVGFYALRFCQERRIDTTRLGIQLGFARDPAEEKRVAKILIEVSIPEEFPEKYRPALIRAVDQCAVKRHILEPPEFEIRLV
jgi:putative redox protein